ncbi:Ketoisovalerate oxidoreductase subunit VorA [Geodia barretti]|uniref:Ketoisovalerate oxidoreductase subunit VorA n=1 Tax=Geodia barretti TaxID=519541 RepID=A0AA35X5S0_GEOBA|nr:Ketoisovalerate oxidoreductase subunit VorA [Geodia barretti]
MTSPAQAKREALTGNKAAALALKLARTQVLCYFPIGPSDEVGEELSRMIQRGELPAEVIELEHERSVMNAQITATQSGARCSFATNSEARKPLTVLPPYELPTEVDFIKNLDFAAYYGGNRMSGYGYIDVEREYMERRFQLDEALNVTAKTRLKQAHKDYVNLAGRGYGGLIETYQMEDAEVAIIAMGSLSSTSRLAVHLLREQGKKVGLIKIRTYRPFPSEDLVDALQNVKGVVVLDRNTVAAVYNDLRSSLFGQPNPPAVLGRIIGLGGRDVTHYNVVYAAEEALAACRGERTPKALDWHFEVIEDEEMLGQVLNR